MRLLATQHVFVEVSPDVFADNNLGIFLLRYTRHDWLNPKAIEIFK